MIKCRIHIRCGGDYMDKDVFVEIKLPCLPHIGDTIFLGEKLINKLEKMATKNVKVASKYTPDWFYRDSLNIVYPSKKDLKNLSFSDANTIKDILFRSDSEFVDIEIGEYK